MSIDGQNFRVTLREELTFSYLTTFFFFIILSTMLETLKFLKCDKEFKTNLVSI